MNKPNCKCGHRFEQHRNGYRVEGKHFCWKCSCYAYEPEPKFLKGEEAERDEILAAVMKEADCTKPNAFIVVEGDRLGIYPAVGGALFAQIEELRADIAPGH